MYMYHVVSYARLRVRGGREVFTFQVEPSQAVSLKLYSQLEKEVEKAQLK